jgi:CubicO group peptidase (beta-lactamase class C family)
MEAVQGAMNPPRIPRRCAGRPWLRIAAAAFVAAAVAAGCGGGSSEPIEPPPPSLRDPWAAVTAAIEQDQPRFPGGLTVEVMTPAGVVYSGRFGGFGNTRYAPVASASKMVTASVFLRLVEQGVLSLDTTTKSLLVDRQGRPWSGNMGEIRLRHLLSFTAGISSDVPASESDTITLAEAVQRIYEEQSPTAAPPGSYFHYGGGPHMRIAARMAEIATGKTWRQIYDEQLRVPLGFSALSTFAGAANPNPAGSLVCTGVEYTRFLMMQLRQGLDGANRLLSQESISQQREDAFASETMIRYSPYRLFRQKEFHYGFGNWLETADGGPPGPAHPLSRWSSIGKFGWAPWIAGDGTYAALIMTQQADAPTAFLPSDDLKNRLDPLIREALATNPPVVRPVP